MVRIAPSILSADFAALGDDIDRVRPQTDLLHVDVMDGHFVPNLTIGPPVVACIRKHTDALLDCHLMMTNPGHYLDAFAEAGAEQLQRPHRGGSHRGADRDHAPPRTRGRSGRQPGDAHRDLPPLAGPNRLAPGHVGPPRIRGAALHGGGGPQGGPGCRDDKRRGSRVSIEVDGGIDVDTAAGDGRRRARTPSSQAAPYSATPDPEAAARAIRSSRGRDPGGAAVPPTKVGQP